MEGRWSFRSWSVLVEPRRLYEVVRLALSVCYDCYDEGVQFRLGIGIDWLQVVESWNAEAAASGGSGVVELLRRGLVK